jgi:hypothetical protein
MMQLTAAELTQIRDAYVEGQTREQIARLIKRDKGRIAEVIAAYGIDTAENESKRREAVILSKWGMEHPGCIAQALKVPKREVMAIAERLGLQEGILPQIGVRRKFPWPASTVEWAKAHPEHREAHIILGEMERMRA